MGLSHDRSDKIPMKTMTAGQRVALEVLAETDRSMVRAGLTSRHAGTRDRHGFSMGDATVNAAAAESLRAARLVTRVPGTGERDYAITDAGRAALAALRTAEVA